MLPFLAYLPQLGARLHLSHTKLNVFAVAGNSTPSHFFLCASFNFSLVGVYISGPFWGKIIDARGPRPLLVSAFIFLLSGYSGIRGIFDAGLGEGKDLDTLRFIILVLCGFFSGVGGHAGMISALNTTAKNFPDHLVSPTTSYILLHCVSYPFSGPSQSVLSCLVSGSQRSSFRLSRTYSSQEIHRTFYLCSP